MFLHAPLRLRLCLRPFAPLLFLHTPLRLRLCLRPFAPLLFLHTPLRLRLCLRPFAPLLFLHPALAVTPLALHIRPHPIPLQSMRAPFRSLSFLTLTLWIGLITLTGRASERVLVHRPLAASLTRVPQTLLNLAHSVEAQREMKIPEPDRQEFEDFLRGPDAEWMRNRSKPEPEVRAAIARGEVLLAEEVGRRFGEDTLTRLRQFELQAQGTRALLRPEIVEYLEISPEQLNRLDALFAQTDEAAQRARQPDALGNPALAVAAQRLRTTEGPQAEKMLTHTQRNNYRNILGVKFDTSRWERVFPLAPELIDSGTWLDGRKARLADFRGKVVLVHFYAFQCHNCRANFHIYNRWYKSLREKGVELIGIQTPETAAERDPAKVTEAAHKDGFEFPVLIDLKNQNWDAWGNTMWPTVYVIDKRGYVRHWWMGELNWQGAQGDRFIERLVDRLRAE